MIVHRNVSVASHDSTMLIQIKYLTLLGLVHEIKLITEFSLHIC